MHGSWSRGEAVYPRCVPSVSMKRRGTLPFALRHHLLARPPAAAPSTPARTPTPTTPHAQPRTQPHAPSAARRTLAPHAMAAAADKPTLAHGPQVWARNAFRKDALWPVRATTHPPAPQAKPSKALTLLYPQALLADAERDAPESVRLNAVPGRQCVMFFGPSSASVREPSSPSPPLSQRLANPPSVCGSQTRLRDWYWRTKEDILPWKGGAFQPDLLLVSPLWTLHHRLTGL